MHELEVKNIADAESNKMQGLNPIINGQVTREDIEKCEADPEARLTLREVIVEAQKKQNKKGVGYTPKQLLATQVVAGTNYMVIIKVDGDKQIEAKIFKPLPCNGTELKVNSVKAL